MAAPARSGASLGAEGLELRTSAGWTAKEMVAHVAFWDEAVLGVVVGMFRRDALPDGWTFGSGYLPAEGQTWPTADEQSDHAGYFSGLGSHYAEHQPELDRLISAC